MMEPLQFYVKVPLTKRVSKTFDWLDFSKWSAAKATAFLDEVEQWDLHRPAGRNLFSSIIRRSKRMPLLYWQWL